MPTKQKHVRLIDWVNMGMFPPVVCFSCGYTKDELCAYLKKIKANDWLMAIEDHVIDPLNWYALKREIENTKTGESKIFFYIIIPRFNFDDDCFVKLAHEVLHICQFYLPDILDRNREYECEAYLHTHIMRQCLKKIRG